MSRNGSGVYSLPSGTVIANGDPSDAGDLNVPLADIAADLNVARPVVAGGTGASTASGARTALGVAIGTDVQAYDAGLASIAGLTTAADKMVYTTALDTYAVADLTAAGRALLDDADASAQRTTLGLGTAAEVDVIDEDDMVSDSATRPPSQQSTKAYVDANSGYTMLTPIATTSGTEFDFTIPSTAREIIVLMDGISGSGTDDFLVQLIDGGGAQTTGYASTSGLAGANFTASSTSGFVMYASSAPGAMTGALRANLMTGFRWISDHSGFRGASVPAMTGGGSVTLGDACVGVRFTRSGTDTFDAGQVAVGYR